MKRTLTPWLLALLVVGALVAAACGSSNEATDQPNDDDGATVAVAEGSSDSTNADTSNDGDATGGTSTSTDNDSSANTDTSTDADSGDTDAGGTELVSYVSHAMERTAAYDSYEFSLEAVMTGLPDLTQPMVITAEGALDAPNGRMYMAMDMSAILESLAGQASEDELALMKALIGDGPMEFIADGSDVYISWGLFNALFGAETKWVKFTDESGGAVLGDFGSFGGMDLGQVGAGPAGVLELYSGLGEVKVLGSATIRGVATTGYEVTLDVDRALELVDASQRADLQASLAGVDNLPLGIWVDDDGLLRRLEMYMDGDQLGQPGASVTMRFDLFNFGEAASIDIPSDDEVTELDGTELFGGF